MLTVTLYNMSAEDNRMDKSSALSEDFTIQAVLKYPTSVTDPVVEIKTTGDAPQPIFKYNYAYIKEFERYYFITNITSVVNGIWSLSMHVDVLMTFQDGIRQCNVRLARTSDPTHYNKELGDKSMKIEQVEDIENVFVSSISNMSNISVKSRCIVVTTINQSAVGFSDQEGDDSDYTSMIRKPASVLRGGNSFTTRWVVNLEELKNIASASLRDAENVASYIISIVAYPINFEELSSSSPDVFLSKAKMKLGDKEIVGKADDEGNMYYINRYASGHLARVTWGKITVDRRYNDFRDFNPYTKFTMYLPYYGNYDIDPIYLYRGIYVDYIVDFATGALTISISIDGTGYGNNDNLVESLNAYIGVEIAIDATNAEAIQRKKNEIATSQGVSAAIGVAMSILGIVLMATGVGAPAGGGLSTVGIMTTAGGVAATAGATATAASQAAVLKTSANGSVAASNLSPYFSDVLIISRTIHNVAADPKKVASVYGYPSDYVGDLTEFYRGSYVLVEYVHVEAGDTSLKYSLSIEREEIEQKLLSGIVM